MNFSGRYRELHGVTVRTDTPEQFMDDLKKYGYIRAEKPVPLLLRSLPVSHGPTGIFLFIAVVFPSCCLLVYRYLANMSSRYLHSLTYHYSNNISCYNIRSLVYHYPKNVSCQYLHGLTCHNPSNIGENPGLPPDCHLLCLLLALTIHVYI